MTDPKAILRDALQLALARIEFNARNIHGSHPYDSSPMQYFGEKWRAGDAEEYDEWLMLNEILASKGVR